MTQRFFRSIAVSAFARFAGRWLAPWLALMLGLAQAVAWAQPAPKRVAFVVGNAAYQSETRLTNPHNDAALLARTLRDDLKFDEVIERRDLTRRQLVDLVREVRLKGSGADAVFVYYSGHGMQGPNGNYLIPTDARIENEDHLSSEGINARDIVDALRSANPRVAVLVLDACRDSPYSKRTKSSSKGLARMNVSGGNLLVAYATSEGNTADDGSPGNSPYARALAQHLRQKNQPLLAQFDAVRRSTLQFTSNKQSPTREGDLEVSVYLTSPFGPVTPDNRAQVEDEAWALCRSATSAVPCEDYLSGWPQGRYRALVQTRLRDLRAAPATLPAPSPALVIRQAGPGSEIKDCEECPTLVVLPRGSFSMGSPEGEADRKREEGPVRQVSIGYGLAVGKFEVSVGEFRRFALATGYKTEAERDVGDTGCASWSGRDFKYTAGRSWRDPGFTQADSHPVVCVSWNDAQEYLTWLNGRATGNGFRLLSEAEWEYAARAGQRHRRYPWGDEAGMREQCTYANGMDTTGNASVPGAVFWSMANCSDGHAYTAPADALKPNAFGLHHMHGNAWEWVQDVWHDDYQGGPTDGSPWTQVGYPRRVLRGGAWDSSPEDLRSASRGRDSPRGRSAYQGFRIAKTL